MANNLAGGFGLRPIGLVGAGANTTGTTQYEIASNNTNAFIKVALLFLLPQESSTSQTKRSPR